MEFVLQFSAGHFAADETRSSGESARPYNEAVHYGTVISRETIRPLKLSSPVKRSRPGPLSDQERFPRRLDWPLVSTIEGLRDAIFEARERRVGVRIPVITPGASKLPIEPPVRLCFYLGTDVLKGNLVRRSVPNCTSHALGFALGSAEAVFRRAYFPAGFQPVSEWHVEYSIELLDVPMELIPESFRCEDEA